MLSMLNEVRVQRSGIDTIKYHKSNALNSWKLNIFQIIDGRIPFYFNNLDLLPPKPKFTSRHLKKGIQEFH